MELRMKKMKKSKKHINNCRAVVIVHGKSEEIIVRYIKSNLRLRIEIHSNKKGKKCIKITSLKDLLNKKFKKNIFFNNYFYGNKDKKQLDNFKLFIIMDTDDCTKKECLDFINKDNNYFDNHWL